MSKFGILVGLGAATVVSAAAFYMGVTISNSEQRPASQAYLTSVQDKASQLEAAVSREWESFGLQYSYPGMPSDVVMNAYCRNPGLFPRHDRVAGKALCEIKDEAFLTRAEASGLKSQLQNKKSSFVIPLIVSGLYGTIVYGLFFSSACNDWLKSRRHENYAPHASNR